MISELGTLIPRSHWDWLLGAARIETVITTNLEHWTLSWQLNEINVYSSRFYCNYHLSKLLEKQGVLQWFMLEWLPGCVQWRKLRMLMDEMGISCHLILLLYSKSLSTTTAVPTRVSLFISLTVIFAEIEALWIWLWPVISNSLITWITLY